MTITEPATLATDVILAGVVGWFGVRLVTLGSSSQSRSTRLWGFSFLASALSAALGGAWHGFHESIGPATSSVLWKVTMLWIGAASVVMILAAMHATVPRSTRRSVTFFLMIVFGAYATQVTMIDDEFVWAIAIYVPAMIAVAALMICRFRENRRAASAILPGIALSFVAAAVQQSGLALHRHFNANDLYHVIQLVAFWLLYRGGIRLEDHEPATMQAP